MVCKMKISEISEGFKSIIKNTANKLSGAERREYIGEIVTELLNGNPRKAEGVFGCGRETVKTGIAELTTSVTSTFKCQIVKGVGHMTQLKSRVIKFV